MPTLNLTIAGNGGGANISQIYARTAPGGSQIDQHPGLGTGLPIGYAGTLTTRSGDDSGEATLGEGHGITTGMLVDVYWDGGVHYGMTVGTVSGTAVPLTSSGDGDVLPAQDTALVISPCVTILEFIDGDNLVALILGFSYPTNANGTGRCHVQYLDSEDTEIVAIEYAAHEPVPYDIEGGATNPWDGEQVLKLIASNSSTTLEGRLQLIWVQNTAPAA